MNNLKLNTKFQILSAAETNNIKGGWLRGLPILPPAGPGGIGGTPPPVTSNSTNTGGGNKIIIP